MLNHIQLNPSAEIRLKRGHLWIYSNEINNLKTPLKSFETGELINIHDSFGNNLGVGYINPHNLLAARLLTRDPAEPIDTVFFQKRFHQALMLRQTLFSQPYYRLIYGESDGLPGLVIDRFGEAFVIQINTAGIEKLKNEIISALLKTTHAQCIIIKNASSERANEGMEKYTEIAYGQLPDPCIIEENQCQFMIDLLNGQKTGWFYDHRFNRARIATYCNDKDILDVFCYTGAFTLPSAKVAKQVVAIDSSSTALSQLDENCKLNALKNVITHPGKAQQELENLNNAGKKFDVIILDPPAFIKRKKDYPAGLKAYQHINEAAMRLLNPHGILLSASCSMHLSADDLLLCLAKAGHKVGRQPIVLEQCHQAPDHPIHPSIPETNYLKGFIVAMQT
ncbi:MAG: class I SAM-dependent rRNA methyltransferase [Pseudomonadota bacterium]